MKKILWCAFLLVGVLILLGLGASVQADISFENFQKFSGSGSGTPDVRATIKDVKEDSVKYVEITMDATNLLGSDKITEWYFNVNPAIVLKASDFLNTTLASANDAVTVKYNALRPGGGGFFDIEFTFSTGGQDKFGPGEWSTWTVTSNGLVASDFKFMSELGPGTGSAGPFYTAVKLGNAYWGATGEASTMELNGVPIPEPTTMLLLGSGLIGLAGYGKKKFFKK